MSAAGPGRGAGAGAGARPAGRTRSRSRSPGRSRTRQPPRRTWADARSGASRVWLEPGPRPATPPSRPVQRRRPRKRVSPLGGRGRLAAGVRGSRRALGDPPSGRSRTRAPRNVRGPGPSRRAPRCGPSAPRQRRARPPAPSGLRGARRRGRLVGGRAAWSPDGSRPPRRTLSLRSERFEAVREILPALSQTCVYGRAALERELTFGGAPAADLPGPRARRFSWARGPSRKGHGGSTVPFAGTRASRHLAVAFRRWWRALTCRCGEGRSEGGGTG